MKKLSMFMAMVMCATLALSGCGNSVSDDRAQAYASLSSMTNLEQDQVKDYKQRLTTAPDSAAIKSVLADAKAANDKVTSDNAKADKDVKEIEAAITGVKLVGTGDCADVTLIFNADKTWQISGGKRGPMLFTARKQVLGRLTLQRWWHAAYRFR